MSDRTIYDLADDEREVLLYYLNGMRRAVVRKTAGLSEEQLRTPGVPSGTSLLGLLWHLSGVEVHWFQRVFAGEDHAPDRSMQAPAGLTRDVAVAAYEKACARSDAIVRACSDLSTRAAIANPGEEGKDSLRVILAHMIRETARHAGHADILRERIDGATGQ
jgi:uncharacterized damage-inducible protein DinB